MNEPIKRIKGLIMFFDTTPLKWNGTVQLRSSFADDYHYITSRKESIEEAIAEILARYSHKQVIGIKIEKIPELEESQDE